VAQPVSTKSRGRRLDLLTRVRRDIERRKTELRPAVDEARRLHAALAALNGKGASK
jgi:hypothetical protein